MFERDETWRARLARGLGERHGGVRGRRVRLRGRALLVVVALVSVLVGLEAWPASAGVGDLGFESCWTGHAAAGCSNLPGGSLVPTGLQAVAVSPDGRSVYVAATDRVEAFAAGANGALTYKGCITDSTRTAPASTVRIHRTDSNTRGRWPSVLMGDRSTSALLERCRTSSPAPAPQGQITYQSCVANPGGNGCTAVPGGTPDADIDGLAVSANGTYIVVRFTACAGR
jgi:hypothetical protein